MSAAGTPKDSRRAAMASTALSKAGSSLSPAISTAFQPEGWGSGPRATSRGSAAQAASRRERRAAARLDLMAAECASRSGGTSRLPRPALQFSGRRSVQLGPQLLAQQVDRNQPALHLEAPELPAV